MKITKKQIIEYIIAFFIGGGIAIAAMSIISITIDAIKSAP